MKKINTPAVVVLAALITSALITGGKGFLLF